MVKWDEETKLKMLLVIIGHLNPASLPWPELAAQMGPEYSTESLRQQYKSIKKGFKPAADADASTPSSSAKTKAPASKSKSKTPTTASGAKSRKRKVSEANVNSDDDEPSPSKAAKVKTEASDSIGAEVFKAEPNGEGEGVDLEHDELYSAI